MSYSYIYIYYFGGKITYFISNHQTYLRFFLFLFLVYGKRLVSKVSNENCRLYCEKTSKNHETFCYDGINLYLCSNINNY